MPDTYFIGAVWIFKSGTLISKRAQDILIWSISNEQKAALICFAVRNGDTKIINNTNWDGNRKNMHNLKRKSNPTDRKAKSSRQNRKDMTKTEERLYQWETDSEWIKKKEVGKQENIILHSSALCNIITKCQF